MILRWISFVLFAERFPKIGVPRFRAIFSPSLTLNAYMLQKITSIQERFQMVTEGTPQQHPQAYPPGVGPRCSKENKPRSFKRVSKQPSSQCAVGFIALITSGNLN
jgi:hypothetical protein